MRFEAKVGARGQVVIPKPIRDSALAKYKGSLRKESLAMELANPGPMGNTPGLAASPSPAAQPISPIVSFPYGFPSPGRYRIFIQIEHASTVETGVFDAEVRWKNPLPASKSACGLSSSSSAQTSS